MYGQLKVLDQEGGALASKGLCVPDLVGLQGTWPKRVVVDDEGAPGAGEGELLVLQVELLHPRESRK